MAMGYSAEDIMPVSLSMRGAIKEDLGVEGGIILKVSISNDSGPGRSCKQLVYLSKRMTKAFLCREALEQLGIISSNFPEIDADNVYHTSSEPPTDHQCNCPKRPKEVPPIPTSLPPGLTATEKDVPALKEWLLDYLVLRLNNLQYLRTPTAPHDEL